ncbi:MAG: ABC transporter transmembrane domain-containing protein [Anderseniella sp.]|nr:ABC transporter transmembrane domain-containing protein [Anderseniella sp.]
MGETTGGKSAPGGRPKSRNLKPLSRLMPYLFRYRRQMLAAGVFLVLAAASTLVVPVAVRRVIDNGFSGENAAFVDQYFSVMMLVVAVLAVSSAGRYYFVTWIGERVTADLRDAVFAHLLKLSPSFYDEAQSGEVLARLTADTTQVKNVFGSTVSVALRNIVMLTGAITMLMVTSLKLSGMVLLVIPLIVLPMVIFGRKVRALSRRAQDTLAASAATAQESLYSVQAVQAFGQEPRIEQKFHVATEEAFVAAAERARGRALLTAAIIFLAFGAIIGILWYGAQEVLAGDMTPGTLGQFLLYAAFAAGAMGSLSEVWGELQLAAGAAERLSELLDTEPAIADPSAATVMPEPAQGAVTFEDVVFAYPTRPNEPVLHGLDLRVEPGETVAIVGPSGAGKSTLFSLILRFYDPQTGVVRLDGVNVADVKLADLRERIALVPQDTVIFSANILENIRFSRPDASDEEVLEAARLARVDEFAKRLGDGFNTHVGERGVTLSGGQRQRVAIARAVLRSAPLLLLDEATSALDAESEQYVQAAFEELMKKRTTLVIAHRLATVRNADRIVVLDGGKVVATGTHAQLMKKGGLYARLAKLQFNE